MCLIFVSWQRNARYPLVVAANRDEFHARPTEGAAFWDEHPGLLAGRDLEAGGTWLGLTRSGRFAAVTNFREMSEQCVDPPSRGALVSAFLTGGAGAREFCDQLMVDAGRFRGFNLLVCDGAQLCWVSNRAQRPRTLAPGCYGLSNHLLDTPWPKVHDGKRAFATTTSADDFDRESLFRLLASRSVAPDAALPDTGLGLARERELAPAFIQADTYGTRCSTVLTRSVQGGVEFEERRFDAEGRVCGSTVLAFAVTRMRSAV